MNIKRGLTRCWIVVAVAIALLTAVFSYHSVRNEFEKASVAREFDKMSITLIPVLRAKTRGEEKDYSCNAGSTVNIFDNCWYQLPKFRELFPEYRDMTDDNLVEKTYREMGRPVTASRPWSTLFEALAFGLGVPLVILIVGASLYWAIAGFWPKSTARS